MKKNFCLALSICFALLATGCAKTSSTSTDFAVYKSVEDTQEILEETWATSSNENASSAVADEATGEVTPFVEEANLPVPEGFSDWHEYFNAVKGLEPFYSVEDGEKVVAKMTFSDGTRWDVSLYVWDGLPGTAIYNGVSKLYFYGDLYEGARENYNIRIGDCYIYPMRGSYEIVQ